MGRVIRAGVSFPEELLKSFDRIVRELGLGSRSHGIQEAIRAFISINSWRLSGGEQVAGVLLVHYSHEERGLEERLTDIQHDFIKIIPSTLHLHLTKEDCLLLIAVRGKVSEIKKLTNRIRGAGKLKQLMPVIVPIY